MKYQKKNGKYIFEKDGVFFALTEKQAREMREMLRVILKEPPKKLYAALGETAYC